MNTLHRAQQELTLRVANQVEANLLIHATVGTARPGEVDVEDYVRVRCYQELLPKYPTGTVKLALLPPIVHLGSPRETLMHAIIHRNYGCSHVIVERHHTGSVKDEYGKPFCCPCAAQQLLVAHQEELGITPVPVNRMVYLEDQDTYVQEDEVRAGARPLAISGRKLRHRLAEGQDLPTWFTFEEVAHELQRSFPPRQRQGFTVFFTGLSGAGKSTIANILRVKFLEMGGRPVTLLDGDLVRKHLSSELGFSREHRDINIRRIGYVASEITKNGGIAICAPIAPYDSVRKEVRAAIQPHGGFVLVYLSTDLATCERRDHKGLYAKARAGMIQQFTGISDPYEAAEDAEIAIDTSHLSPEDAAQHILLYLERQGYISLNRNSGNC
jgi:sulfate adenylyltransferase